MYNNFLYESADLYFEGRFNKNHFLEKKMSVQVFENATVLPYTNSSDGSYGGGVIDKNGKFIIGTGVNEKWDGKSYAYDNKIDSDEIVIFIGTIGNTWGHAITDELKRFWFILSDEYKQKYKKFKLLFNKMGIPSYQFKEICKLFDIDIDDARFVDEPTKFKRIIIPDSSFGYTHQTEVYYTTKYIETIDYIINKVLKDEDVKNVNTLDKIFFTYKNSGKEVSGLHYVEKLFKNSGFAIIDPVGISLREQIYLYNHCTVMAGFDGSVMHNSLFMKNQSKAIIIPRSFYLTDHQLAINQMKNLEVSYVDATMSNVVFPSAPWASNYFVIPSKQLCMCTGADYDIDKESAYKYIMLYADYFCKNKIRIKFHDSRVPKYYSDAVKIQLKEWQHYSGISDCKFSFILLAGFLKWSFKYAVLFLKRLFNN